VGTILAVGLSLAVLCVTVGVLYDAIVSAGPGLSDNATQVLTTAFGGIIGVLGSYVGYQAGVKANGATMTTTEPPAGDDDTPEPVATPVPDVPADETGEAQTERELDLAHHDETDDDDDDGDDGEADGADR